MAVKDLLRRWQYSDSRFKGTFHVAAKAVWRIYQFATIPELRWQRVTGWLHSNRYYQRSTFTAPNRYPELFEACRRHLEPISSPRILSFGCSTGDELLSLAEYMPRANIIGIDINPWCLKQCRQKCKGEQFQLCLRTDSRFDGIRDCDVIFCLAVLQRSENRDNPDIVESTSIRFEQFEREIEVLDSKLRVGGLFVIDHADFSFAETRCSRRYEPLEFDGNCAPRIRPMFDRHSKKVSEQQAVSRVFVKLSDV